MASPAPCHSHLPVNGFSLAELLIALGVIGLVSVLFVPGLLNQTNKTKVYAQMTRDIALSLSAAYAGFAKSGLTPMTGTINIVSGSTIVTGTATNFTSTLEIGDEIQSASGAIRTVSATPGSNTSLTVSSPFSTTETGVSFSRIRPVQSSTTFVDMLSYVGSIATDTTTNPSSVPAGENALSSCSVNPCLQLQNGALLQYSTTNTFSGNAATNYITLALDPDGANSNAGKVSLLLYKNGRVVNGSGAYGTTGSGALSITTDPVWLGTWGNG
jgi:type II secretory pathway pseudopilin PulG